MVVLAVGETVGQPKRMKLQAKYSLIQRLIKRPFLEADAITPLRLGWEPFMGRLFPLTVKWPEPANRRYPGIIRRKRAKVSPPDTNRV